MALDEATSALLVQMSESGMKPMHEMTPEEARGVNAMLTELCGPGPDMVRVENVTIPASHRGIPARVLVPTTDPRAVIIYYHGGGWVIGALDEFDTLGRQLAERTSSTVVLVDYRLAPEHRYPAAVEDAYAALEWVAAHLRDLAHEVAPLVVMGDSSGGNLAAVAAQRARQGGPAIAAQVLVYPITDCDTETSSYLNPQNQLMLTRDNMIWFWNHYAPDPSVRTRPDASPARAASLAGLPPTILLTAEHDVLRDEAEAYGDALRKAGVPVIVKRFGGQMHPFFTMPNVLPGVADALAFIAEQLDHLLGWGKSTSTTADFQRASSPGKRSAPLWCGRQADDRPAD